MAGQVASHWGQVASHWRQVASHWPGVTGQESGREPGKECRLVGELPGRRVEPPGGRGAGRMRGTGSWRRGLVVRLLYLLPPPQAELGEVVEGPVLGAVLGAVLAGDGD